MNSPAILVLEDGSVFEGLSFGADQSSVGEVIFNTAITGYQEIITDPSYARQIITLTHPQIGNVGVNRNDTEADRIWASAVAIKNLPRRVSSWRSELSLSDYLKQKEVPGICGIDTRRLTRLIRSKGAQNACVMPGDMRNYDKALSAAREFAGLKGMDLAKVVTAKTDYIWHSDLFDLTANTAKVVAPRDQKFKVIAYDFGIKQNILRMLVNRGCAVYVVPAATKFQNLPLHIRDIDGVFLSNGPGDPEPCTYAIDTIRLMLKVKIPMFGICLGHQLLALAAGAKTMKMKFGHHGANHPVRDMVRDDIMITSQNHGFAVDEEQLPDSLEVTHRSLFDHTIQGIRHRHCPAFSFQGHPEASPGPHDCARLFDQFIELMTLNPGHRQSPKQDA